MAGPTKKPKNPEPAHAAESGDESMSEESDSGGYHGQQVNTKILQSDK